MLYEILKPTSTSDVYRVPKHYITDVTLNIMEVSRFYVLQKAHQNKLKNGETWINCSSSDISFKIFDILAYIEEALEGRTAVSGVGRT